MSPKQLTLQDLYRKGDSLVRTFPPAHAELLDFFYKSRFEDYVEAIRSAPGRKLVLATQTSEDLRRVLPVATVLADTVIFNVSDYAVSPALSFFPIPDDLRSPVLGMLEVIELQRRKMEGRPPHPSEVALLAVHLAEQAKERGTPEELLGIPWGSDVTSWRRSQFTRTLEPFENELDQPCHIAAGFIHVAVPRDDPFFDQVAPLMAKGKLVFAPYVRLRSQTELNPEPVLKSRMLGGEYIVDSSKSLPGGRNLHALGELTIPYLGGVDFPTLMEILENEGDSVKALRLEIDRLLEDLQMLEEPLEAKARFQRFKREVFEDQLADIEARWRKVSRMRSITRMGAYVTTATIGAAGMVGLAPPELLCGISSVATATVAELYKTWEESRSLRRSPMQIAWRVKQIS